MFFFKWKKVVVCIQMTLFSIAVQNCPSPAPILCILFYYLQWRVTHHFLYLTSCFHFSYCSAFSYSLFPAADLLSQLVLYPNIFSIQIYYSLIFFSRFRFSLDFIVWKGFGGGGGGGGITLMDNYCGKLGFMGLTSSDLVLKYKQLQINRHIDIQVSAKNNSLSALFDQTNK